MAKAGWIKNLKPLTVRFWQHVKKSTGCWEWQGVTRGGYGRFKTRETGRRYVTASRLAWELTYRPIPSGMKVLHRCDNPPCCRPSHLFLGSQGDNVADCNSKGRASNQRGIYNGNAKLTVKQVKALRAARSRGIPLKLLSDKYGVSSSHVSKIAHHQTWKHVA